MVIDKREFSECIKIYFDTIGKLSGQEIENILENVRIVVEQRENIKKVTIIKL